jgi:hypothetical protein
MLEIFTWQSKYYEHVNQGEIDLQRIRENIRDKLLKWEMDKYYYGGE